MQERTVTSGTANARSSNRPSSSWPRRTRSRWRGTYPLPEAQLDRFLQEDLVISHAPELSRIVERTIATEDTTVHAVLDRDDVLQLRSVCREVSDRSPRAGLRSASS